MPNHEKNPNPETSAENALSRARSVREAVRAEAEEKERTANLKRERRIQYIKAVFRRSCFLYTVFNIIQFFAYLIVIYPYKDQPFSEMILGGISVIGHVYLLGASVLAALIYSLLLYRRPYKKPGAVIRYLTNVCIWYTGLQFLMIALHGLYLDMMYNPYAVTEANLFLGPSYLLSFACLGFSLCILFVNRIFQCTAMPTAIRVLLHLTLTLTLAAVFFHVLSSGFSSAADLLIFLVVFSFLYLVCCGLYYALHNAKERDDNEESAYTNVYLTDNPPKQNEQKHAGEKKNR